MTSEELTVKRMKVAAVVVLVTICGCAAPRTQRLEFLTREGCVQTKIMRARLDKAIESIGKPISYDVVDLDVLRNDDLRKGYPTPTILRGGVDLFGMTQPTLPYPEPT